MISAMSLANLHECGLGGWLGCSEEAGFKPARTQDRDGRREWECFGGRGGSDAGCGGVWGGVGLR